MRYLSGFLVLLLLPLTAVLAQEHAYKNAMFTDQSLLTMGLEQYDENYTEYSDTGGKFMQQQAWMTSVSMDWHIPFEQAHAVNIGLRMANGQADYVGALQGGIMVTLHYMVRDVLYLLIA